MYDVLDHTTHIFSENLSSGDDNVQDKDKDKYKMLQRLNVWNYFRKTGSSRTMTKTKTKSSKTQCLLYFLKTDVQGYHIWYFLLNFQRQITKKIQQKIPRNFSINYFSHQIFSTNKFHSNILPKMFYQKISTKSVPPSFFLFHISVMTNSRSFLLIVLYVL